MAKEESLGKGIANAEKEIKRFSSEIKSMREESVDDKSAEKNIASHAVELGTSSAKKMIDNSQEKKDNKRMSLKDRTKAGREYVANKKTEKEKSRKKSIHRDDLSL